jgi:hypothetical protein
MRKRHTTTWRYSKEGITVTVWFDKPKQKPPESVTVTFSDGESATLALDGHIVRTYNEMDHSE